MAKVKTMADIKSVRYDVEMAEIEQADVKIVDMFIKENAHENVCIEYEDHGEAVKRRACLRTWLNNNGHTGFYTSVRNNKVIVLKEKTY